MMDVCTLIVITTLNAVGCMTGESCTVKNDRKLCLPTHVVACPQPVAHYECKKPDGTTYLINKDEAEK